MFVYIAFAELPTVVHEADKNADRFRGTPIHNGQNNK